jgi:CheY-like chemotaxis protein
MSTQPVVFVEDDQYQVGAATELEGQLGAPVHLVRSYEGLIDKVTELAEDPELRKPVVVLDPGLPGRCRLDTVQNAVADLGRRALIVQWTASRAVATHTGALIEGARASLPKTHPAATLAAVVRRVGDDRFWCEPGQAQWFDDLLLCVQEQSKIEKHSSIWHWSELSNVPEDAWFEMMHRKLAEIAEGGEMGANDDWFEGVLTASQRWWLSPRQRQVRTAVLMFPTRGAAATALGVRPGTVDAAATRVGGRLMPYKYLSKTPKAEKDAHWITKTLVEMHIPCELSVEDHLAMFEAPAPEHEDLAESPVEAPDQDSSDAERDDVIEAPAPEASD